MTPISILSVVNPQGPLFLGSYGLLCGLGLLAFASQLEAQHAGTWLPSVLEASTLPYLLRILLLVCLAVEEESACLGPHSAFCLSIAKR